MAFQVGPKSMVVLAFLRRFQQREGFSPSHHDIADALGFASPTLATYHLRRLEEAGLISRAEGAARAIRLRRQ